MEKRNKAYVLFIYGVWTHEEEMVRTIRDILMPVVESGFLKFVHGPGSGVVTFKSLETFEDIDDYLKSQFPSFISNYIFMPKPRKVGHNFKDGLDEHLFDVNQDSTEIINRQNEIDMREDIHDVGGFEDISDFLNNNELFPDLTDILGQIDGMFESFVSNVKNITISKDLDLDEILDKITEKGVSSLTEEEKEYLNNQNK